MKTAATKTRLALVTDKITKGKGKGYNDLDFVVNYDKYAEIYNTPERVEKFLKEHPCWSEAKLREKKVLVIDQDDVFFDHEEMDHQPREDGTDEGHAKDLGVSIAEKGMKKPITAEWSNNGKFPEKKLGGRKGHHRHLGNGEEHGPGNQFIPTRIVDLSGLSWPERNSYLKEDNRHDENGKRNTTHGIKLDLAANLEHPTYFPEEKQELNLLYASLNDGNNSAEQEKLLKKRIECLEKEIKDDLARSAKLWGINDLTTAKRHATEAWNNYQQTQIYKIYPTPEKERISNYNSAAAKYAEDKNIITYRWMYKCGGGSAYLYKAVGAINDMITERVEKQGVDPGDLSVKVFVTLKSPKGFEGFFADRKFIQSELNRFLCFKTLVGKGIECFFAGQVQAKDLNEDIKEFYTLEESEERYAKYLAARREKK